MEKTKANKDSSEAEFQRCYNDNADNLFRFFLYKVSDMNVALDLFQDDFFKLWKAYTNGQKINSCKSWLYKVGTNSVIDWYRRKRNLSLDLLQEAHIDFAISEDEIYVEAEQSQMIQLFNKLPAEDRQILILRFIDGLPIKKIAEIYSMNPKTVPIRVFRALKVLRELVKNHQKTSQNQAKIY